MEIKCQLDATDGFLLQIFLLAQHVSGTTMPIIRSSRVLYRWLLPVVFGAVKMEIVICRLADVELKQNLHPLNPRKSGKMDPNLSEILFCCECSKYGMTTVVHVYEVTTKYI